MLKSRTHWTRELQLCLLWVAIHYFILFFRANIADRFIFDKSAELPKQFGVPSALLFIARSRISKALNVQGLGRHTEEEIKHITRLDVEAISNVLGKNNKLVTEKSYD